LYRSCNSYQKGRAGNSVDHNRNTFTGRMPMIVEFPDNKTDKLIEDSMEALGDWVESEIEKGVSPIILIGLMETYKSALTNNLLVDEDE